MVVVTVRAKLDGLKILWGSKFWIRLCLRLEIRILEAILIRFLNITRSLASATLRLSPKMKRVAFSTRGATNMRLRILIHN